MVLHLWQLTIDLQACLTMVSTLSAARDVTDGECRELLHAALLDKIRPSTCASAVSCNPARGPNMCREPAPDLR